MITDKDWKDLFYSFSINDPYLQKSFKYLFTYGGIDSRSDAQDFLQILDSEKYRKRAGWFFSRLRKVITAIKVSAVLEERARKNG